MINDDKILNELVGTGIQKEALKEIVELVISQFQPMMVTLEAEIEQQNGQTAHDIAHVIKGSMANTIFPSLRAPSNDLYMAIKHTQWSMAVVKYQQLQERFKPIHLALLHYLEQEHT